MESRKFSGLLPELTFIRRGENCMKKIAVIEDGYVRDSQLYTGDPANIGDDTDWENNFIDIKNPCQFVGIFEGETEDEIKRKAAKYEGVHPGIISLINLDGNVVHG
jgi:hypothetical protein